MRPGALAATVSVIIPTRNRRALLEEAVESVRRQTYANWELIVVDDCSEDDTWAWLSSLDDPRIRAIRLEEHSERSAARNRGLEEAKGEWVLFLDDDDRLRPEALKVLLEAGRRHPDAVGVAGGVVQFDGRGHRRRVPWVRRRWVGRVWPQILWGWWILPGQAIILREQLVDIGGWASSLAGPEDQDLWLRLGLRGAAVLVPPIVLENRVHTTWRGADTRVVEEELRAKFVRVLSGTLAGVAQCVMKSREAFGEAANAYTAGNYWRGLKSWARSVRLAPKVVLSAPLRGRVLALGVRLGVGALCGRHVVAALRRLRARTLRALRRAPEGAAVVSGSAVVQDPSGGHRMDRRTGEAGAAS